MSVFSLICRWRRFLHWPAFLSRVLRLHFFARDYVLQSARGDRVQRVQRKSEITVSLSTIPSRLPHVFPVLASLLDQSVAPKRIILILPRFSERERRAYVVPQELENQSAVEILWSEKDWGPATKIIPSIQAASFDNCSPLLCLDDDNIYPRTFIETFELYSQRFPEAALSLRGWNVPESYLWRDVEEFDGASLVNPEYADVIQGCGGILVRPSFFDEALLNYDEAPRAAYFVDDVWISGNLARRHIPRYVIPIEAASIYFPSAAVRFGPALDKTDNADGTNDQKIILHFNDAWKSSRPAGPAAF